jgi:hypothetical protein
MSRRILIIAAFFFCTISLMGCDDLLITNDIKNPYKTSLSVGSSGKVNFFCEEGYLIHMYTEDELIENTHSLANDICPDGYSIHKIKTKSLSINPGEYYSKVSASFSCNKAYVPEVNSNAKKICRSLFGSSQREYIK